MEIEYEYKLNPYRQLRKRKRIKGVRRTIRSSHTPRSKRDANGGISTFGKK